jgi:hypothetical protein
VHSAVVGKVTAFCITVPATNYGYIVSAAVTLESVVRCVPPVEEVYHPLNVYGVVLVEVSVSEIVKVPPFEL